MPAHSVSGLLQAIRQFGLLEPVQLEELLRKLKTRGSDPRASFQELIDRGLLTRFQIQKLLHNKGQELVLGSYVLLDKLGEGGMGEVFKARHQKMGRVVAVKLIRKDRLKNPEAIQRFKREIKATAQLNHPNIVLALDADQAGDTHFLVMEHVEGIDLYKLTRESGPLAVGPSCDYIRQAAFGLQHAFEKGLVHRDIKPSNLFLVTKSNAYGAAPGTIKLLDLGLARLQQPGEGDPTNNLTQLGKVVGTVDFIAPEQALDSRKADVRSDLYSLGCTFYFILARKIPFQGEVALEKLAKHRWDDATPIEQLRPEVPPGVAAIVRKLMAKKPEDRYQTPAELAAALTPFSKPATPSQADIRIAVPVAAPAMPALEYDVPVAAVAAREIPVATPTAAPVGDNVPVAAVVPGLARPTMRMVAPGPIVVATRPRHSLLKLDRRRWLVIAAVVGTILVGALVLLAALLPRGPKQTGTVRETAPTSDRTQPPPPPPATPEGRFTNSVAMQLIPIRPGTFLMGSLDKDDRAEADELPQHEVTISRPYFLGVHEVTQRQFEKVMGRNPAQFKGEKDSPSLPVESVTWDEAVEFCARLSALEPERRAGRAYRLPTEAEWEFACRAGSRGDFCFGNDRQLLGLYAWWAGDGGRPRSVGSKAANTWGFYDTHGNVREWCSDFYDADYYKNSPKTDPTGPASGTSRVCRGGSVEDRLRDLRSARRSSVEPGQKQAHTGFRVACGVAR